MNFLPKEKRFFDLFDQQSENVAKAAEYFKELVKTGDFSEDNIKKMRELEHEGDSITHEITDTLNRTF
ncbi:MAG: DUF47 family protein, partial [Elusimicrobia bacterium]|nr:DUF47 family protein [Elusimicrobiota bacterium]